LRFAITFRANYIEFCQWGRFYAKNESHIQRLRGVIDVRDDTAVGADPTADLTGTITDPTGAVVGNAKIMITNSATAAQRRVTSNEAGVYSFPSLPPGVSALFRFETRLLHA
jgi:hypothetical protein